MRSTIERFWKYVPVRVIGQCWLWVGNATDEGYGRFTVSGRVVRAHRFSWELVNGPIPNELQIRHTCDTPRCVNPEHLLLGTNVDNVRDRVERGRNPPKNGENNGRSILTEKDIIKIRSLFAQGYTQTNIAEQFGMSIGNVNKIVHNKLWNSNATSP